MRPFEFVKPDSEASAIELLGKLSHNVRILAGGTDYLVDLKQISEMSNDRFLEEKSTEMKKKIMVAISEDGKYLGLSSFRREKNLSGIDTISINDIKDINEKTIPSMMGDELQG